MSSCTLCSDLLQCSRTEVHFQALFPCPEAEDSLLPALSGAKLTTSDYLRWWTSCRVSS